VIRHPEKLATPELAPSGFVVQPSVAPLPGWVAIVRVTDAEELVTVLPAASWTVTTGCCAHAPPETPPPGCVVKASFVAAPVSTVASAAALVAVHVRHTAVTVYAYVPAASPVSVHEVAAAGDEGVGQSPPDDPPSRRTTYVTGPTPVGGLTVVHVSVTLPALGTAPLIDGAPRFPMLAEAAPDPLDVK
jgi:hypothetical protein